VCIFCVLYKRDRKLFVIKRESLRRNNFIFLINVPNEKIEIAGSMSLIHFDSPVDGQRRRSQEQLLMTLFGEMTTLIFLKLNFTL
jgi:hypothetical protein